MDDRTVDELERINKRLDSMELEIRKIGDQLSHVLSLDNFMKEGTNGLIMRGILGDEIEQGGGGGEEDNVCTERCAIQ
jgi:hypothetical protein